MASADKVAVMQGSMNEEQAKLARYARALNTRHSRQALPSIVLMTDDARDADWIAAVSALPAGCAVVVRHRDAAARERLARQLRPLCRAQRISLLIADDPALAQRIGANGVHLPERQIARLRGLRSLNARWIVTCSGHGAAAIQRARATGADAVFVSPVFATSSHPKRAPLGVVRFAALTSARIPIYALGGIETKTIRRLLAHRIVGVGLIGGWIRS